jgi:hypothetical protein
MKIQIALLAIFAASFLPSCESTALQAQPLILTCEDKKLMRKPYTPCPGEVIPVDCSCK